MMKQKLTDEKVHKICKLLCDPTYRQVDIAIDMNVSFNVVHSIFRGRSYKRISSQYDFSCRFKRPYPAKIGDDVAVNICEMLQNTNMSLEEIAKEASVSRTFVEGIYYRSERTNISKGYVFQTRKRRYPVRERKISDEVIKDICELLLDPTLTMVEIADVMNVSAAYVGQIYHHKIVPEIVDQYEFPERSKGGRRVTKITTTTKVEEVTEETVDNYIDTLIAELPEDLYDPNLEGFEEPEEKKDPDLDNILGDLQNLLNSLKEENAKLKDELKAKDEELVAKDKELEVKEKELRTLRHDYDELDEMYAHVRKSHMALMSDIKDLVGEYEK